MVNIYKNKDADLINKDLSEQFKKDDKTWYRDDQEIYGSAKKVIERYINEIKSSKSENFGPHALKPFIDLQKTFDAEWTRISKLSGWASLKLCTDNKNLINKLANEIDDAEKVVLERLAQNRATFEVKDIENNKKAGSEFFKTSSKGEIVLTSASNRPKIQEVLWTLFKNDSNKKFLIDYSGCTNESIKSDMKAKIGTDKCWISYDTTKGTYLLKDSNGNPLPSRALVWEGVKLIPEGVVSVQAKQKMDKQLNERTNNLLNRKITDTEKKEFESLLPVGLRTKLNNLWLMSDFLAKADKRLGEIIVDAKKNGYELRQDAVSKRNFALIEIHFMYNNTQTGESAKKDVIVRNNDGTLDRKLYDLLDGNEGDLKTYIERRLGALWENYDHLTKRSDLLGDIPEAKDLTAEQQETLKNKKDSTLYSLTMFQQMLKKLREKEGTSRDDDEKEFNEMLKFVRDAIASLEKHTPSVEKIDSEIIAPLKKKWRTFQLDNISVGDRGSDQVFSEIFSNDKNTIIKGMRKLWLGTSVFGNTHTSFLAEEIAQTSTDLEIKDTEINKYFQNLTTKLDIMDADNENTITQKKKLIDGLYVQANGGEILNYLVEKGLLPISWKGNKDVTKECAKIKDKLDQKQLQMQQQKDIYMHIDSHVHTQISEQKMRLEQKTNKTEKELQELQAYTYLVEHPSESTEMFEMVKENLLANLDSEETKYRGIGSLVRTSLLGSFVDKGKGVKGTNADILEDMYGVGWFNLSDENSAELGPMIVEIIITVVVTVVLSLCTFGAWWAAFLATRALAHAGVKTAMKIAAKQAAKQLLKQGAKQMAKQGVKQAIKGSLQNLTKALAEQWRKEVGKQAVKKTVLKWGKLLVREAPMFNALNAMAHNIVAGKEIFDGMSAENANIFSKENVQTAAFLMVLHGFNAPGSVLRAGKPIQFSLKNSVKWGISKWLPITAEFGAMLGAEQTISMIFGRPLLDENWNPVLDENGEVILGDHGFHMPTAMEASQILGMVLAFKIPMVNKMISKWSDHWFEWIDIKTGERGVVEVEGQLKSQERKVNAQREKVTEKQKARDHTNQQIMDIKRAQESVAQKTPETISIKAEDIAKNRESYYENFAKDSHPDLYERYQQYLTENPIKKANALKTLDTEFAERLILDNPASQRISYGKDKARAELSFEKLQELSKYKKNLELTQTSTGERVISYVEGIGKLKPLESRVRVQERELNDLDTELNRRVKDQEGLQFEKKEVINEFIRENESLSQSDFVELFGKDPTATVIKQWELWLCYEYTANTLLKNADFFEAFIRTSVRKIDATHFSMEMPLADGKTYTIKISKAELEASHTLPDGRKIPAVSDTQLWFQIMEMAFIKHSVLLAKEGNNLPDSFGHAIEQFSKTGDFEVTGDMLSALEWGRAWEALEQTLGSLAWLDWWPLNIAKIQNLPRNSMIEVFADSKLASREGISLVKDQSGKSLGYKVEWVDEMIIFDHSYAITKRGVNFIKITNPHDTSKPIRMTLEQFKKAFTDYAVYKPDIGKILSKKVSHEILPWVPENHPLQGIKTFTTEQGSVYTVLPDGRTQRYKTAAGKNNYFGDDKGNTIRDPSDYIFFVKNVSFYRKQGRWGEFNTFKGQKIISFWTKTADGLKRIDDVTKVWSNDKIVAINTMNGLLPSTKKILTFDEINKIKEKLPELRKKYLEKNPQQQKRATEDKFFDIDEGNISLIPEIGMHTYDYKINEKWETTKFHLWNKVVAVEKYEVIKKPMSEKPLSEVAKDLERSKAERKNGLYEPNTKNLPPESKEILRSSDVVAIGDLHGEMVAFKENMESAGLIDTKGNWIGGNRKVVFQGDIIADRGTDGLEILQKIHILREQAQKAWGDIEVIVGNHDDFMISFLTGRNGVHGQWVSPALINGQWVWLWELMKFTKQKSSGDAWNDLLDVAKYHTEILETMRKPNSEWRIILEEICNMKIVSQVNDVLLLHTNPTDGILKFLTEWGWTLQQRIEAINNNYQLYLRKILMEWKVLTPNEIKQFNELSDLFLDTSNRNTSNVEDYYKTLKNWWINYITHGHNGGKGSKIEGVGYWWIKIIDNDYGYWKLRKTDWEYWINSVSVIGKKTGGFRHLGEHKNAVEEIASIKDIEEIKNKTLQQPMLEWVTKEKQIENLVSKAEASKDGFISMVDEIGQLTKWTRVWEEKNILKKKDRIKQKIKKDYKDKVENCLDVLRSTLTFKTLPDLIMAYDQLPFLLQQHGLSIVKLKNRLVDKKTWEVLMNIEMSDGMIVELKLSTEHMHNAQDVPIKLPDDVKISFKNVTSGEFESRPLSDLFTSDEINLVSSLHDNGLADEPLLLESGYFKKEITNHMFYEIARCFDAETQASINNNENLNKLNVELQTLINKLEAIQVINGEYHIKQYEAETNLLYN